LDLDHISGTTIERWQQVEAYGSGRKVNLEVGVIVEVSEIETQD
jgi:hypothetical protein